MEGRQKYSAVAASTSRPVKQSKEEQDAESDFNTHKYTHANTVVLYIHTQTRF